MKKLKGSLTVEAAMVLPIFLMAILSIIYIIKIIYIQENVQYSLSETANEMSTYAYVLEKSKILSTQQQIYSNAIKENNEQSIINNSYYLYEIIENASSYTSRNTSYEDIVFEDISNTNNLNVFISNYTNTIKEIKNKIINNTEIAFASLNIIMDSIDSMLKGVQGLLINECLQEGFEVINNYVGSKIAEDILSNYITDEEYKKWYIVNGKDGMDFKNSKFMLEDEDIDLIVNYKIAIPIPFPGIKDINMMQRVKVRGFTGNRKYYNFAEENEDNNEVEQGDEGDYDSEDEIIVYSVNDKIYHLYITCLNNTTIEEVYDRSKHKAKLCERCSKHIDDNEIKIVYHTPNGAKYHVNKFCTQIYSEDIKELTLKEAKKLGMKLCKNCKRKKQRIEIK
ncbi:MAG: pilus assembly protein [Vallitalea sp.]|jgi:hypothetical protein|nr:pilus assembly protein [Vallitalea sp.]